VTSIALCRPGHDPVTFRGSCKGSILTEFRGVEGFGYDPVFLLEGSDKTFAELSKEEKNRVSHRAIAMRLAVEYICKLVAEETAISGEQEHVG